MLSARSAWEGRPGQKLPALVFIAPARAKYKVEGQVIPKYFEGGGPVELLVLKRTTTTIDELKRIDIQADNTEPVALSTEAELSEGQELALVPIFNQMNHAVTLSIADLKVSAETAK